MGQQAQRRIKNLFSLDTCVDEYFKVYQSMADTQLIRLSFKKTWIRNHPGNENPTPCLPIVKDRKWDATWVRTRFAGSKAYIFHLIQLNKDLFNKS